MTVHIQDVMHASPQPTAQGGRRTMYVTHYPTTLWDHIGPGPRRVRSQSTVD